MVKPISWKINLQAFWDWIHEIKNMRMGAFENIDAESVNNTY